MKNIPRILITPGEPAGVGPDIFLQAIQKNHAAELVVICDPDLLTSRAALINLPLKLAYFDKKKSPTLHQPGIVKIIPVKLSARCEPGKLNSANSNYVLQCLTMAADYCLENTAALVTGPVQKSIMMDAKIKFSGHTEFFADYFHASQVMMLFVADEMKVALASTHLPLSEVPKFITTEKLISQGRLLHTELKKYFAIQNPRILVCGLNPHAGENGHLGTEEIEIITPAIQQLQSEKIDISGPLPADTIFTEHYLKNTDAILAMYHDQALPVVKYLGFGRAINMTLGLPIIRTSVDHGTALDKAGTLAADAGSLMAAIELAIFLST